MKNGPPGSTDATSTRTVRDSGQRRLMPVHKQLFVEANPIPVKWAMARMGLCGGALRLPMTPLSPANEAVVEAALRASGILA